MNSVATAATTAVTAPATGAGSFAGTGTMLRLALRRDRILIPAWLVVYVGSAASSAAATVDLYPDLASREAAAASVNNASSLVAMYGRVYDVTSLGEISMFKMGGLVGALVAVFAIILTVRHTRAEEEAGRLELLGSGVLGRFATLTSALIVVAGTSLLLGLLTAASLAGAGLPVAGSLAFGLAWTGIGVSFAAVAAICAQLTTGARAATGTASAVLGLTYLLRAIGDTAGPGGPGWESWLSPVGWGQQVRPFAGGRWWVLGISVLFSAVAVAVAFALTTRRDLGAGLLADRPGRAGASRSLGTPLGLAFRLQRGTLLGWTLSFAVLGSVLGNLASNIGGFLNSPNAQEMIRELGGRQTLVDAFLATEMSFVGVFVAAYGVQATLRLRGEETALRAEPLLSAAVGRRGWLLSHLTVAVLGAAWLLAVAGLGSGLSLAAAGTGGGGQVGRMLGAALAQLPAVLVMIGLVVTGYGLVPRWVQLGWGALVVFLLIGELGPLFDLDQRVMDLSPFAHSPKLPGPTPDLSPLVWLTLIGVTLVVIGVEAFRRRDLD
jgi:ABC-2 type transport system permease protein